MEVTQASWTRRPAGSSSKWGPRLDVPLRGPHRSPISQVCAGHEVPGLAEAVGEGLAQFAEGDQERATPCFPSPPIATTDEKPFRLRRPRLVVGQILDLMSPATRPTATPPRGELPFWLQVQDRETHRHHYPGPGIGVIMPGRWLCRVGRLRWCRAWGLGLGHPA